MTRYPKNNSTFCISDRLWQEIQPIVKKLCPRNKVGRPRMNDRKAFNAIFYLMRTGIHWNALPKEFGASSTIHDRFKYFSRQGLFRCLWRCSILKYNEFKTLDWEFLSMDGCHSMAPLGGEQTGPSYKHRGKSGVNRSLLTDGNGIPLALVIAPANHNDSTIAEPTLHSFIIDRPDPTLIKQHLCLDKGYDSAAIDALLERHQFISHIRRRGIDYSGLSLYVADYKARRWVVERSHSWFNRFRRILLRWEKKARHYLAFMHFACAIIIYRKVLLS